MNRSTKILLGSIAVAVLIAGSAIGITERLRKNKESGLSSIHTTAAESTVAATIGEAPTQAETKPSDSSAGTAAVSAYQVSMEAAEFGGGRIRIEYPVISGMEDGPLQDVINKLLKSNAISVMSLYPVHENEDSLDLKCSLNYISRSRVSVLYTGILTMKEAPSGADSLLYAADDKDRRLFFTNTVDLHSGKSLGLQDFLHPSTAAAYLLSEEALYEGESSQRAGELRTYFSGREQSDFEKIFAGADFREGRKEWPQSFCYEKQGSIIFSVPVPERLGDYALLRFEPHTK